MATVAPQNAEKQFECENLLSSSHYHLIRVIDMDVKIWYSSVLPMPLSLEKKDENWQAY